MLAWSAATVAAWQREHSAICGCGAGGGAPWQLVQPSDPDWVQLGESAEAPAVGPWQKVSEQTPRVRSQRGAREPTAATPLSETSAGSASACPGASARSGTA
jgi:hypothetical protein